jgi:hypothetical protein
VVQPADRRVLVLEMRKKHGITLKYQDVQAPTATNEQTPALKVPIQIELRFHSRRYEQPPTLEGLRDDKTPGGSPPPAPAAATTTSAMMTASKKVRHVVQFRILFLFPFLSLATGTRKGDTLKGILLREGSGPRAPY